MSAVHVLGVDPAAAGATGYGVIEADRQHVRMLRFGAIRPQHPAGAHLVRIHDGIRALISEFAPEALALESVFASLNVKTALRLAEVRGVILLAAEEAGIPAFSYSPREVKMRVAGHGQAGKEQVQHMVRALLGMSEIPEPWDAADALAVAICHTQMAASRAWLEQALPVSCCSERLRKLPHRNRARARSISDSE